MITRFAHLKSPLVFAGLALTLLTSAGMPMLGGQDAMAKNHKQRGQHSQVQRDHKTQNNQRNQNTQAQGKSGKHCVTELVAESGEVNQSCYRTFEQAQIAASQSGGGGDTQGRNYQQSIVAVLYDNVNYDTSAGTNTLTSTAPDGCNNGSTLTYNTFSFNNRVSSAKVYSGCKATFFADTFLSGTSKTGSIANGYDIPNMESFNDLASSVFLSKG